MRIEVGQRYPETSELAAIFHIETTNRQIQEAQHMEAGRCC